MKYQNKSLKFKNTFNGFRLTAVITMILAIGSSNLFGNSTFFSGAAQELAIETDAPHEV